ncbi:lipase family protein [Siccirubricoccus phaeus]|uniref:lipase family protein n=1 Tax=Siccirubricoccus phaeus TaxID=2595053 RepID=UPI0011F3031C|nr:lipase family protein [Siccirubricoccus phaeus]
MSLATDAQLAQLSLAAYSDTAAGVPPGFSTLAIDSLPIDPATGASFANGVYHNGNAAALVTSAELDGQTSLVVAFRGSDDGVDSQHSLSGINQDYALFAPLVAAVDAAAASGAYDQVVVTGHSAGGAMAQLYMASHPDQPGSIPHDAVTFGSPGAMLPPGGDARPTNYVVADDPAVFLGAHRAEIGEVLRADGYLADAAAARISQEMPGLTHDAALATLGTLTVNYENRGDIVLLPTAEGQLSPEADIAGLAQLDPTRHDIETYLAGMQAAAAGGPTTLVPPAPQGDPGLAFLRDVYNSDPPPPSIDAAGQVLESWAQDLRDDAQPWLNDAFTTVRDGLGDLGHDLNLI